MDFFKNETAPITSSTLCFLIYAVAEKRTNKSVVLLGGIF